MLWEHMKKAAYAVNSHLAKDMLRVQLISGSSPESAPFACRPKRPAGRQGALMRAGAAASLWQGRSSERS